jgi:ankyrin repeat protein
MTAHLELLLDRAAASKPNPGSNRHLSPIAATNGSVRMIQLLLKADPETVIGDGETALMTASRSGNLGVVKLQTEHGANVNAKEKSPARQR